MVTLVVVAS